MNDSESAMAIVKTRRLAAMQKQQRAKAGMKPPVRKGGATTIENGQVLCSKCNASKGAR